MGLRVLLGLGDGVITVIDMVLTLKITQNSLTLIVAAVAPVTSPASLVCSEETGHMYFRRGENCHEAHCICTSYKHRNGLGFRVKGV